MDENKFKAIIEEAINKAIEPVKEQLNGVVTRLDDPDTGLKRINDRLDANTRAVMELETTVKGYGDMYKINDSNLRKMEKRVETLEDKAGVVVPEEFHLAAAADI
ncbi:hypothetical protein HYU45_03115 [Candidatus Daviesbacteria bacterium]|nr:hypothetical protein [Candidatus Daviesbacteria bacterium]